MARLGVYLRIVTEGLEEAQASLRSIAEGTCNAGLDDIGLEMVNGTLVHQGMTLTNVTSRFEAGLVIVTLKPTSSMILYVSSLMTRLPARATVTWRSGWPHLHCPPRDDRDAESGPPPLVPGQLEPA